MVEPPPLFFLQDNVFQCQLPHQFRDVDCNKSDLKLSYVDSNIASPLFSKIFLLFYAPFFLMFIKFFSTLFFAGPMVFQFSPKSAIGEHSLFFP